MPRTRRATASNFPHLVHCRAAADLQIFFEDQDYAMYLDDLRELARGGYVDVYAFALLPQEMYLTLTPRTISLPQIIQRLHVKHTKRINKKLRRRGSLFSQRFASTIFEATLLPDLVRFVDVVANRGSNQETLEADNFSSHNVYCHERAFHGDWIKVAPVLRSFGWELDQQLARRRYQRFVADGMHKKIDFKDITTKARMRSGADLSDQILTKLESQSKRRRLRIDNLTRRASLLLHTNTDLLRGNSRKQNLVFARRLIATVAVTRCDRSVQEVANYFSRDKSQISRLVTQGLHLLESDEVFKTLCDSLLQHKVPIGPKPLEAKPRRDAEMHESKRNINDASIASDVLTKMPSHEGTAMRHSIF